jgi:lantibiotic leader peptide-processing serine protease
LRRVVIITACAVVTTAALALPASAVPAQPEPRGQASEYVVLYKEGVSLSKARAAVKAAGGTIVRENTDVGVATVRTTNTRFAAAAARQSALDGTAANRVIGRAPKDSKVTKQFAVEKEGLGQTTGKTTVKARKKEEPLADLQWDMKQIHATADGSYQAEPGDRRVLVGVIDTGIDGNHPDIKPNFNSALSRNFTTDIPTDANGDEVDGPCGVEPDKSCNDPADVDENEHGTHIASTIASPRNKLGMAGVAPGVSLVNLRAGQDSGHFFLQPSVDALTYAGKHGIDVVNMSYYIHPWLFNCAGNPADSPEDQAEQRTIIEATNRALNFAHRHGVTLIAAAGNEAIDYTTTTTDTTSPDFASEPGEQPYERTVPPSCLSMPGEGNHVIPISSTGISKRKAYYSSYGKGYIAVAAPGGDKYDTADHKLDDKAGIWAAYPESIARKRGELNADGTPNTPRVVRGCRGGVCAYYQATQGTSMASPHAAGVAALIVSKYGTRGKVHGGRTMDPAKVRAMLTGTATQTPCPAGGSYTYTRQVRQADGSYQKVVTTHTCKGSRGYNGFYGYGIVDALKAVQR